MLRTLVSTSDPADEMRKRTVNCLLIEQSRSIIAPLFLRPCGHGRSKTVHGDLASAIIKPSEIVGVVTLQPLKREMDGVAADALMRPTPRENEAVVSVSIGAVLHLAKHRERVIGERHDKVFILDLHSLGRDRPE